MHFDRLLILWQQIAQHYQDYPNTVMLELLNEPNSNLTEPIWNEYALQLVDLIRAIDPERTLIYGGVDWNGIERLEGLALPENTDNLIITFHNYSPFEFTHQGAEWVGGANAWLGTIWDNATGRAEMSANFDIATDWQAVHNLPLLMGEFGAYSKADMDSRQAWTRAMVEEAEARGIGWCYWEYAAGFGIYDRNLKEFNALYSALIPN